MLVPVSVPRLCRLYVLSLCCWPAFSHAVDSLAVGMAIPGRNWTEIMESSRLLSVAPDSIWIWKVEPGANLARGIGGRGGKVRFLSGVVQQEGTEAIYDGDPGTALNPDQFPKTPRTSPLLVYLGGPFRVNRIRFYPRLDQRNQYRFLQEFSVLTSIRADTLFSPLLSDHDLTPFHADTLFSPLLSFFPANPNTEPVVDQQFESREVSYIRIEPTASSEWEIAELEIYSDGTAPEGEFVSSVLKPRDKEPLWGKVRFEGGPITGAPVVIQTRTGPDPWPVFYYLKKGDELVQVDEKAWTNAREGLKGPARPNPEWSGWAPLDEGRVRSPGLKEYLQFRVHIAEPGARLQWLIFEYTYPPLVQDLAAELNPTLARGGQETEFTLSMEVHLSTENPKSKDGLTDTGFRELQVLTAAEVHAVERVLVDDQEVAFTYIRDPSRGFTVNLWQRILQNGSFAQVVFRGAVFRDHTRFEVRAVDRRKTEDGVETAYQLAREADIEPGSPGGSLSVRLETGEGSPLVAGLAATPVFTPNGDGINDLGILRYALLKLVRPVPVSVAIYDLNGRLVRQLFAGTETIGSYHHAWDGRAEAGALVAPGLYLYELKVEADEGTERRRGAVGVAY